MSIASLLRKLRVRGDAAHDAADTGNPVGIGARAVNYGSTPTPVHAGDRASILVDRHGIPFVIGGQPNVVCGAFSVTSSRSQIAMIADPGANKRIIVTQCNVALDGSDTNIVAVAIGFGIGATVQAADASGRILSHPGVKAGGGIAVGNASGIVGIGGANESLDITCDAPSAGLMVGYTYYIIDEG